MTDKQADCDMCADDEVCDYPWTWAVRDGVLVERDV